MKAAVLWELGKDLEVRNDVGVTGLGATDVHVKMVSSGVCHSDVSVQNGTIPLGLPAVLGHEGAGIVQEVGKGVTTLVPGDHVILSFTPACRVCRSCMRGQSYLCETTFAMMMTPHFKVGDKTIGGMTGCGTFAQEMIIPEAAAIKVDNDIPLNVVSLIGCGVMTGVGAAVRLAPVEAGASVAVIGCGAVGLNALQGARLANAGTVIAIDRAPGRQNLSRLFGADLVTGEPGSDVVAFVKQATQGRGADYVFEAAGSADGFRLGAEIVRPGGQLVFLGKVNVNQDVAFRWGALMGEKKITRSSYGGARPKRDFPWLARCYLEGKLKLDELITARLPLQRINDGFDAMRRGEGIRTVVLPWD